MNIQSKGVLFFEMMKVKEAVKNKDGALLNTYYQAYQNRLKVPKQDVFRAGSFTVCSERVSYHLLSIYLLLDMIDYCWDGERFIREKSDQVPELLQFLTIDDRIPFRSTDAIKRTISEIQNVSRIQLHLFLLPFEHPKTHVSAYTHPGNALILFSQRDNADDLNGLHRGLADFYLKKQLNETLPYWASTEEEFITEFQKWCRDAPSKFTAKKVR